MSIYRVKEKKFIRLADENFRTVTVFPKERWATVSDIREYDRTANLDGRDYEDLYAINLQTGARTLMFKKIHFGKRNPRLPSGNIFAPSPDGTKLLYFEGGNFYTY